MSAGSLAGRTARGFLWATLATLASKALAMAALMVLARILAPGEFGLFAVALAYLVYLDTIGDLGMGAALTYWPDREEDAAQLSLVLGIVMGLLLALLTFFTAPGVAAFFRQPDAEPILRVLGFGFLIKGLGNTHDALLRKALRFKARLLPELALSSLKALVAVTLALSGFGVWSLVWGHLIGLAAWSGLLWKLVAWRPALRWPRDLLRPMLRYSAGIIAVNVLAAVTHHADFVVVGRVLGAAALGFYQLAYRLPEMVVALLVWQAGRVLFPAFAHIRSTGDNLGHAYLEALRWLGLLVLPISAALCLLARPAIVTLFGSRWEAAAPIMQALAVYAAMRALGSPAGDVLKASGRSGLLALLGALKAIVLVPALVVASRTSAASVAAALAAVTFVTLMLNVGLVCRLEHMAVRRVACALRDGLGAASIVALALVAWLRVAPWSAGAGVLATAALVAFAAYLTSLRLLCPDVLRRVRVVLRPRFTAASLDRTLRLESGS